MIKWIFVVSVKNENSTSSLATLEVENTSGSRQLIMQVDQPGEMQHTGEAINHLLTCSA